MTVHQLTRFCLTVLAVPAIIAAAAPAAADDVGSVALPPGSPISVYPRDQVIGGADPLVPFGTDPLVPYGTWAQ